MPDHEADAGIDQRVRSRLGLFDAAGIVCSDHPDRLAEHPAVTVQLLDRDLDRGTVAGPGRSIRSGKRAGEADPDLRRRSIGGTKDSREGEHETEMPMHGARLLAATDHRDPIRANIGNYNISRGGIRLQVALMPDVGTAAIGRMISGTICRFRCTMAASPARIFAERLDSDIAARFARHRPGSTAWRITSVWR